MRASRLASLRPTTSTTHLTTAAVRRTSSATRRSYASASHGYAHHGPKESLGLGFWFTAAMVPAIAVLYSAAHTAPDGGAEPVLTQWLQQAQSMPEHWADRNAAHTRGREQLAMDTALLNSAPIWTLQPLQFPEAVFFHSPCNISAGSLANLKPFTEFYRQKYWEDDARRHRNLDAARQKAAEAAAK